MQTTHPGIIGRADLEPLAVSPRQACVLLAVGNTRLYQLIRSGEVESYLEGRSRRITMASIRHRLARLLAAAGATSVPAQPAPRRRGRPRKAPLQPARATS